MPAMLEPGDYLRNQASVTEPACAVILSDGLCDDSPVASGLPDQLKARCLCVILSEAAEGGEVEESSKWSGSTQLPRSLLSGAPPAMGARALAGATGQARARPPRLDPSQGLRPSKGRSLRHLNAEGPAASRAFLCFAARVSLDPCSSPGTRCKTEGIASSIIGRSKGRSPQADCPQAHPRSVLSQQLHRSRCPLPGDEETPCAESIAHTRLAPSASP